MPNASACTLQPATFTRKLAAIRYAHRLAAVPSPTDAKHVYAVLRGIRRARSTA